MVDKLIKEINLALDQNLYFAALTIALTLPDICGKAAYPDMSSKKRYLEWYEEYIGQYERHPSDKPLKMPYLSAEVVYSLRCSVLHEGTPNIDKNKINIDHFSLVIETKKDPEIYQDVSAVTEDYYNGEKGEQKRHYRVSVRRLCKILCATAGNFYKDNEKKFDFFDYSIIDNDKEVERLESFGLKL